MNQDALGTILKRNGFSVISALNGEEGIAAAREQQPKIILMDIRMPVMDGLEATQILKEDTLTSHIPIVAVTAHSKEPGSRKNCLEAGCDDFILKPVDTKVLINTINNYLH